MIKHDDGDAIFYLIAVAIGLAILAAIIYLTIIFAGVILTVAGGSGIIYGGWHAVKNYFLSFKENVIDSNKKPVVA